MKKLLACFLVLAFYVTAAFACWQTGGPPHVVVMGQSLNMRATNNDKALKGLKFELHKAITFDLESARKTGAFEKKVLKSATTDSRGLLSFGELEPGRYWIFSGRLSDSVAVEVVAPSPSSVTSRIWWKYYGDDGCFGAVVEDVS